MSSVTKRLSKKITKSNLIFPIEMYNNTLGSLIITHYILSEEKSDVQELKKTWNRLKRKGLKFWLEDNDFIVKALTLFHMEPKWGLFAMCQSKFNVLFCPYIDNQPYPIREDGIFAPTIRIGKIYPIVKELHEDAIQEQRAKEKNKRSNKAD